MKQASDFLNDSDRETLGLKLKKSTKSKVKQQAKKFCTTDQPLDEIQRGSLVNIYMFLFTKFNIFSSSLWILGPVYMSTNFTTMCNIIPSELQRLVYNHVFKKRNDIAKQASPNSKSRVSSIDELIQKRENRVIYDIINKWLWKNLLNSEAGQQIIKDGGKLPLELHVQRLVENRSEIVKMFKALDESQYKLDSVSSYPKMIEYVQQNCEDVYMGSISQSGRVKIQENLSKMSKMNARIKLQQQQQQQQQRRSISIINDSNNTTNANTNAEILSKLTTKIRKRKHQQDQQDKDIHSLQKIIKQLKDMPKTATTSTKPAKKKPRQNDIVKMKFPKKSVSSIEKMLPPPVIPTTPTKESVIQKDYYSDEYHSYDNSTSDSSSSDED